MKGKKTGGRAKGTPNKATAEVKALAQQYTGEAIGCLVVVLRTSESDVSRIMAAKELLDRGHGKARQTLEHEGVPMRPVVIDLLMPGEGLKDDDE